MDAVIARLREDDTRIAELSHTFGVTAPTIRKYLAFGGVGHEQQ